MTRADMSRLKHYSVAVNYAIYASLLLRMGVKTRNPHVIAFKFVLHEHRVGGR
jgi:hypothetical protein